MNAARTLGLAVDHAGLPDLLTQHEQLATAGVAAADRHVLAPMTGEDWCYGLAGVLDTLTAGDVLVVPMLTALGITSHDLLGSLGRIAGSGAALVVVREDIDSRRGEGFLTAAAAIVEAVEEGRDARTRTLLDAAAATRAARTPPKVRYVEAGSYDRVVAAGV